MKKKERFSPWIPWAKRNELLKYNQASNHRIALGISKENLEGKRVNIIKKVEYFGFTTSEGGLNNRFKQLKKILNGNKLHGDLSQKPEILKKRLYISLGAVLVSDRLDIDLIGKAKAAGRDVIWAMYKKNFGEILRME